MRNLSLFVASATLVGLVGGCKSLKQGALEEHAKAFSCPEARIQARARKDLDAYALIFGAGGPSDDIKADPERYAVWQKNEAEKHKEWNASGELFEAAGCGHTVVYFCVHPATYSSKGASNYAVVSCSPVRLQPGAG